MARRIKVFGPLHLVMFCLAGSAMLRMGFIGVAIAETESHVSTDLPAIESAQCAPAEDFDPLVSAVRERQIALDARETEIAERQLALENLETRVRAQVEELEKVEAKLSETLAIADGAAESDIARLTSVYEQMKPQNAARVFENMDLTFAAGFLTRMQPQSAAAVMSELPPELAYSVSVVMAGQNARAPTE